MGDESGQPARRFVTIKIHGMPCVNRCAHCYAFGSSGKPFMDMDQISFVLRKASELKRSVGNVQVLFFDEPSLHPRYVEIMQMQAALGLIDEGSFFLPTNGYGLARLDRDGWKRLAECGVSWLQLTFYGTEESHDAFAGRRGAWDDLVTTIRKADEHGMGWFAGVMVHSGNVRDHKRIIEAVSSLGTPMKPWGWFTMSWQGRGADERMRIRKDDLALLPNRQGLWRSEGEIVAGILSDTVEAAGKAIENVCSTTFLEVAHDLSVSFGGGCDSNPFWACRNRVGLGVLDEQGFEPILAELDSDPPAPVKLLAEVNCRELAEKYGDPSGDLVYHRIDLIRHKWASRYIEEFLPPDHLKLL